MAYPLLSNITFYGLHPLYEFSIYKGGLCISLIFAEGIGVPVLICTAAVLFYHHKTKGRVSSFVITVLLCDLLEMLVNPYIIAKLVQNDWDSELGNMSWHYQMLLSLWSGSRICGVHFQQMVVLESVFALRHSFSFDLSPFLSTLLFVITYFCIFLCEFFRAPVFLLLGLSPLLAVTANLWVTTCRTPRMKIHNSSRTKMKEYIMLSLATFTVILYSTFLIEYIFLRIWSLWAICVCLMSLRVITDPFVCLLAYKKKLKDRNIDQISGEQSP